MFEELRKTAIRAEHMGMDVSFSISLSEGLQSIKVDVHGAYSSAKEMIDKANKFVDALASFNN